MKALDIRLEDIVQEYTKLFKVGNSLFDLCTFHYETKPSFHLDPTKQLYYCHGCHRGGNVKTFLREVGRLDEIEETESIQAVVTKYWNWLLMNSETIMKKLSKIGIT